MFSHHPGKLIPVLNDPELSIKDVVYDGKYVWASNQINSEISVIDTGGKELVRVDKDHGLPPCDTKYRARKRSGGVVIHPLGSGRLLASGYFGPEPRAWIAEIKFDGQSAKVDVFHKAIKVRDRSDNYPSKNTDPEIGFAPLGMFEHIVPGDEPRRIIFILNDGKARLVDPETLKVWCYPPVPGSSFLLLRGSAESFMSIDGLLFYWNSMYRFDEQKGNFKEVRSRYPWDGVRMPLTELGTPMKPNWARNSDKGYLARSGDWLYYTHGYYWRRLNLRTDNYELLNDDEGALPKTQRNHGYIIDRYGKYPVRPSWKVFVSSHYGLVAEREGKIYRVSIKPSEEDAKATPAGDKK